MKVGTKTTCYVSLVKFYFYSPLLILSQRGPSLHSYRSHTPVQPTSDTYKKSVELDSRGLHVTNQKHSKLTPCVSLRNHRQCYLYSQGESIRVTVKEMNVVTLKIGLGLGRGCYGFGVRSTVGWLGLGARDMGS